MIRSNDRHRSPMNDSAYVDNHPMPDKFNSKTVLPVVSNDDKKRSSVVYEGVRDGWCRMNWPLLLSVGVDVAGVATAGVAWLVVGRVPLPNETVDNSYKKERPN